MIMKYKKMSNRKRTKFNGKSTIFEAALKNNKMQDEYITKYISLAKNLIEFFSK